MKEFIGLSTRFLGRSKRKVLLDNVAKSWAFSSSQHVRAATDNVESYLKKKGLSFPKSSDSPLPTSHMPDLDVLPELSVDDVSRFESLVGVLSWTIELGRVDVCLEASMMASCIDLSREGHLETESKE